MTVYKLSDFKGGWFIGDFLPTIFPTKEFEVSIKYYKSGQSEQSHYHKIATELTVIVKGEVSMNGSVYKEGDVILIENGESTDFIPLMDTVTCVVKIPSILGDKYQNTTL